MTTASKTTEAGAPAKQVETLENRLWQADEANSFLKADIRQLRAQVQELLGVCKSALLMLRTDRPNSNFPILEAAIDAAKAGCPLCKGTGVLHYHDNDPCPRCEGRAA